MNSFPHPPGSGAPDDSDPIEPTLGVTYTLDTIARLTGAPAQIIIFYHERGLVSAATASAAAGERTFDDEALRTIRRLEHLRTEFELKEPALQLMASLLAEIERLRDEAGRWRR